MSEFLRLLLDSIAYLWPFRIVREYERGAYYVTGRFWKVMGPGLKLVCPFFTEIQIEGVVRDVYVTPLQTISTRGGGSLTFSATMTVTIADLGRAYNSVMRYSESARESASAILAEKLAEVDAEMLEPEKRGRLVAGCLSRLRSEIEPLGLAVETLRFNNFVKNMRAYRLFQDQTYTNP